MGKEYKNVMLSTIVTVENFMTQGKLCRLPQRESCKKLIIILKYSHTRNNVTSYTFSVRQT